MYNKVGNKQLMVKIQINLSKQTQLSLRTLGAMIKAARLEQSFSQADLAHRLNISRYTVMALEKGDPSVAIGTVFEACTIIGIPLLAENTNRLLHLSTTVANFASVLPERSRSAITELDDNF
ncbi:MAG: helix-turn-helix domain-containing protein [Gammaproteobacteria bacterium]